MKCRIKRGGFRVVGYGNLGATGSEIEVPDEVAEQLVNQGFVEAVPTNSSKRTKRDDQSGDSEE